MDALTCLLMDTAKHLKTRLTKTLKPHNLTCSQAIAMRSLETADLSAKSIGEACSMDKATLSAVLDKLISHGYISSGINENDKREKVYSMTSAGKKLLPEIHSVEKTCMTQILGILTEQEYISLFNMLKKVQDSVEG